MKYPIPVDFLRQCPRIIQDTRDTWIGHDIRSLDPKDGADGMFTVEFWGIEVIAPPVGLLEVFL